MKKPLQQKVLVCTSTTALTLLLMPAAAAQEKDNFTVSGQFEAGVEYNSNVSVTELESATGQADYAGLIETGLDLSWQPVDRLSVDAGYSFSSSHFQEFDEFDLDLHLVYADLSYDFDLLTVGTNSYYGEADLGSESFLTLKQNSLYAARLFGDSLYIRGALNFSDKTFDTFAPRNAEGEGANLDAFWYFNQGNSALVFGLAVDDEDAADDQFSYEGQTLRIRYTSDFTLLAKNSTFELGWRMQDRDYKGITPSIAERRDDQQSAVEARLEVSLSEHIALFTQAEHGDYQSNLSSADYTETRAAVGFNLSF